MDLLVTVREDKTSAIGEPRLRSINLDGSLEWVDGVEQREKRKKLWMNLICRCNGPFYSMHGCICTMPLNSNTISLIFHIYMFYKPKHGWDK